MTSPLRQFAIALLFAALLHGCAAAPTAELAAARRALSQADAVNADEWAAPTYNEATSALTLAEQAMESGNYRRAAQLLPQVQQLAALAEQEARLASLTPPSVAPSPPFNDTSPTSTDNSPEQRDAADAPPREKAPPLPTGYTVSGKETLWEIAARKEIYADPFLWPLIYRANRDQITDPRIIHSGQRLAIPRNTPREELLEVRNAARKSELFPLDALQRAAANNGRSPLP